MANLCRMFGEWFEMPPDATIIAPLRCFRNQLRGGGPAGRREDVSVAITVFLSTTLRECVPGYRPVEGLAVEISGPTTVEELAGRIGLPLQEIKIVMINGRRTGMDAAVRDGDRVGIFPAVGGG